MTAPLLKFVDITPICILTYSKIKSNNKKTHGCGCRKERKKQKKGKKGIDKRERKW